MLHKLSPNDLHSAFATDVFDWFQGNKHGHMGKWQYLDPAFVGDRVRGAELWAIWEAASSEGNMLHRQGKIIAEQVGDMVALTKPRHTLIDLGPGSKQAVLHNTVPYVEAYGSDLNRLVSVDISSASCDEAKVFLETLYPQKLCFSIHDDFLQEGLRLPVKGKSVALLMGGTIGNYEAPQNAVNAIELMADRIRSLKYNLPAGTIIFIGLEATQDATLLYGDYDHPAHAEYEINVLHGIKRDLLPNDNGFDPDGWKYAMKWWPDAYQFCHLAQATKDQEFKLLGKDFRFAAGDQLVIDNSFKFPVLAMQRATQIAGSHYIRPFADQDGRMIVHALAL